MTPNVILHNSISLDGRTKGFNIDIGLHYEVASGFQIDAHLAGSRTIFDPDETYPQETENDWKDVQESPDDQRSILVVPDSRGKVRNWHMLRKASYWKKLVALCSESTPGEHRKYLEKRQINTIVSGKDQVDMSAALRELANRYEVRNVLLDSGGILNGVMLRNGLVNEISLLIHPVLAGGNETFSFFGDINLPQNIGEIPLKLISSQKIREHFLWLRYKVENAE